MTSYVMAKPTQQSTHKMKSTSKCMVVSMQKNSIFKLKIRSNRTIVAYICFSFHGNKWEVLIWKCPLHIYHCHKYFQRKMFFYYYISRIPVLRSVIPQSNIQLSILIFNVSYSVSVINSEFYKLIRKETVLKTECCL